MVDNKELEAEIQDLEEQLEDVQFEKSMVSKQTGIHQSGGKVTQQLKEFDDEIAKLEKKISELKERRA